MNIQLFANCPTVEFKSRTTPIGITAAMHSLTQELSRKKRMKEASCFWLVICQLRLKLGPAHATRNSLMQYWPYLSLKKEKTEYFACMGRFKYINYVPWICGFLYPIKSRSRTVTGPPMLSEEDHQNHVVSKSMNPKIMFSHVFIVLVARSLTEN